MRREQTDIITDILDVIRSKPTVRKTHVMYKANLSHYQLKLYLEMLEKKGLIVVKAEKKATVYSITDEGIEFYSTLAELTALRDAFGVRE